MKLELSKSFLVYLFCFAASTYSIQAQNLDFFEADFVFGQNNFSSPYFGGFDNVQFSNIDLNRDGVQDIVGFDRWGEIVIPFVRIGEDWVYSPEYEDIFPEDIKHWMLLLDFDKDGITDIFCSKYVAGSGIRVFKGSYNTEWGFDEHLFHDPEDNTLTNELIYLNLSGRMRNLEVPTADVPCFADIDFDGDIDVLAFQELGNNIYFFKNTSMERGFGTDSLLFQLDKKCWGGVSESLLGSELFLSNQPGDCASGLTGQEDSIAAATVHATSTLAAYDVDRDGDMDIFVGDADLDSLSYLTNQPEGGVDWFRMQTRLFPSPQDAISLPSFVVPFFVDVNNDGREDMINASNQFLNAKNVVPIKSYVQEESGDFSLYRDDWIREIGVDFGSNSAPVFYDVDQDGLIDIVLGNYAEYEAGRVRASLFYFRNTGTRTSPEFTLIDNDWLNFKDFEKAYFNLKPTFGDLDSDGDDDLIVGTNEGRLVYVENIGGANNAFVAADKQDNYMNIQVSLNASPQIIDLSDDGLNDLVIGNDLGYLNFFENTGSGNTAFFDSDPSAGRNSETLGNVRVTDSQSQFTARSVPWFVNSPDGLHCYIGNVNGNVRVFTDISIDGSDWTEVSSPLNNIDVGRNVAVSLANLDDEDELEVIVGNQRGGIAIFETEVLSPSSELLTLDADFRIFPNPTSRDLFVYFGDTGRHSSRLEIFDAQGKRFGSFKLESGEQRINVSHYPTGVYLCKLYSNNEFIGIRKFIHLGN